MMSDMPGWVVMLGGTTVIGIVAMAGMKILDMAQSRSEVGGAIAAKVFLGVMAVMVGGGLIWVFSQPAPSGDYTPDRWEFSRR